MDPWIKSVGKNTALFGLSLGIKLDVPRTTPLCVGTTTTTTPDGSGDVSTQMIRHKTKQTKRKISKNRAVPQMNDLGNGLSNVV